MIRMIRDKSDKSTSDKRRGKMFVRSPHRQYSFSSLVLIISQGLVQGYIFMLEVLAEVGFTACNEVEERLCMEAVSRLRSIALVLWSLKATPYFRYKF